MIPIADTLASVSSQFGWASVKLTGDVIHARETPAPVAAITLPVTALDKDLSAAPEVQRSLQHDKAPASLNLKSETSGSVKNENDHDRSGQMSKTEEAQTHTQNEAPMYPLSC